MSELLDEISTFDHDLATSIRSLPDSTKTSLLQKCLEALSARLTRLVNEHDFNNPLFQRFMTPSFLWVTEQGVSATTREEFLTRMEEATRANPEYYIDVVDMCASETIPTKRGSTSNSTKCAYVWVTLRIHGLPADEDNGTVRDIIGKLRWNYESIGRVLVKWRAMRGFGMTAV